MLSIHRLITALALLASFVVLSSARPTHHVATLRARAASTDDMVKRFEGYQVEIKGETEELGKLAASGASPLPQVRKITAILDNMSIYLGQVPEKPTTEQEGEIAKIISDTLTMCSKAGYDVAAAAKFSKWYTTWTELDVSSQKLMLVMAKWSYKSFRVTLSQTGSTVCDRFHGLHMRLTVNMMGGC